MLILKLEPNEVIVLRDKRTKKEYARLRRGFNNLHLAFEAPANTEIRRVKTNGNNANE